jgi:hypothetical protein
MIQPGQPQQTQELPPLVYGYNKKFERLYRKIFLEHHAQMLKGSDLATYKRYYNAISVCCGFSIFMLPVLMVITVRLRKMKNGVRYLFGGTTA